MKPIVETERLRLGEFGHADIDELAAMVADADQMTFYPRPRTRAEASEWLGRNLDFYERYGFGFWRIESRASSDFLGYCGIRPLRLEGAPETEIGWHTRKTFWNQGIATEAAAAAKHLAFDRFGVSRLVAVIHPDHSASRRVAEHIEMRPQQTAILDGYTAVIYVTERRPYTGREGSTNAVTEERPLTSQSAANSPTREERAAAGKAAREKTPLASHAEFQPAKSRDPVGLLLGQAETRVPELVPIRHGRMLGSPFAFYRGGALVMAADLSTSPTPRIRAQLCGDAHLSNFGAYASPERRLVFDINDFDETLPGPFEWDVKRLATSFVVAGRDNGFSRKQCRKTTLAAVRSYRTAMRTFAGQTILAVWYAHLDIEDAVAEFTAGLTRRKLKRDKADIETTEKLLAKAHTRDSLQAIGKLTTVTDGRRRIISNPPLVVRLDELTELNRGAVRERLRRLLATYRDTLQSDRRSLFDHFTLADVAHKVVGVGSVGTRAWILLFEAGVEVEALLLQAKQAQRSALADYVENPDYANQGERVVAGQHLMQASSDIFLGWLRAQPAGDEGEDYYLRQLRDWKVSAEIEKMSPRGMRVYARLCGWTLARAHARSGDRIAISAYLGSSTKFDNAVAEFAEAYADQNERDHATFADAVAAGRVEARSGL
jgi:uncharacterized protein (DUF2252 family)/RimJ/RimL family protein N-acetyltransferase